MGNVTSSLEPDRPYNHPHIPRTLFRPPAHFSDLKVDQKEALFREKWPKLAQVSFPWCLMKPLSREKVLATKATTELKEEVRKDPSVPQSEKYCNQRLLKHEEMVWMYELLTDGEEKHTIHANPLAQVNHRNGATVVPHDVKSAALDWLCRFIHTFRIGPCTHIGRSALMAFTSNSVLHAAYMHGLRAVYMPVNTMGFNQGACLCNHVLFSQRCRHRINSPRCYCL